MPKTPAPTPDDLLGELGAIVKSLNAQRAAIRRHAHALDPVVRDIVRAVSDSYAQLEKFPSRLRSAARAQKPKPTSRPARRTRAVSEDSAEAFASRVRDKLI